MASCSCSVDLFNSGLPDCQPLHGVIDRLILVSMKDSSGTANFIDLTSLPTNTAIIDLINNADDKKRLFPFPEMENVTNERADPLTQEFDSGKVIKIRNGIKTFTGQMIKQGATFAAQIDSYQCANMGAYMVDSNGNLVGDISTTDQLKPLKIDMNTWDVKVIDATDTTAPMVTLNFQWDKSIKDSDAGFVSASDFDSDVAWDEYNGLIDLYGSVSAITTTSFKMAITNKYGSAATGQAVSGLVLADFLLEEVSPTPGAITITSVTESVAGVYDFVFPTATSADVLSLSIATATKGWDSTALAAVVITIP